MTELFYTEVEERWINPAQVCSVAYDEECEQYVLYMADGSELTIQAEEFEANFKVRN